MQKRNLAFYKKSGLPWTDEEILNIYRYTGNELDTSTPGPCDWEYGYRWIFDDGDDWNDDTSPYYLWSEQEDEPNFHNCTPIAYEIIASPIRKRKQ